MRFVGVMFDFDGVLLDSMAVHLSGWKHAAKVFAGVDLDPKFAQQFAGMSTTNIGQALARHLKLTHKTDEIINCKIEFVRNHEATLLPGAKEALTIAQKYTKHVAIVSNAPNQFITRNLASHGITGVKIFGLEDHPEPKPNPSAYINAVKSFGVSVSDFPKIIVLEDSRHGLIAGLKANMYGIGICSHHSSEELTRAGAKATYNSALEAMQDLLV